MTGGLNNWVVDIANGFNASQKDYKVVPTYKGTYDDSMTASIAAFRAGKADNRQGQQQQGGRKDRRNNPCCIQL